MEKDTIVINGYVYDSNTGLRFHRDENTPLAPTHHAHDVHQHTQKSSTLSRRYVQKDTIQPAVKTETKEPAVRHSIQKFAPHPVAVTQKKVISDIGPTNHPIVSKISNQPTKASKPALKPSDVIKREEIAKALAAPAKTKKSDIVKVKKNQTKFSRFASLASASLAILLLGGYLTYINMPSISTRVAASQAGIDATYPSYKPNGYSLSGPVAYDNGTVSMNFVANAGPQDFTLTQQRSGWDSSAVLENYVEPKVGDNYTATTKNGLTIYTYQSNAAWINKGILYTIEGSALLSAEQIQNIAVSM